MSVYRMGALCSAAVILVLAGCGGAGSTSTTATTSGRTATIAAGQRALTENDAGAIVTVNRGGTFEIVLADNPSTGFQWERTAGDASIIKQLGGAAFQPDSNAVGAGGKVTLRFEAVTAGATALTLDYRRPWETKPAKTFTVTVQVS